MDIIYKITSQAIINFNLRFKIENYFLYYDILFQAHQVLQYYRQKGSKVGNHPKINDVKVFNTLLHGYAKYVSILQFFLTGYY